MKAQCMTNDDRIIDALGGTTRCAQIFDIKPASVSEWRRGGIPKARLHSIRLMRPDLFEPQSQGLVPKRHEQRAP